MKLKEFVGGPIGLLRELEEKDREIEIFY